MFAVQCRSQLLVRLVARLCVAAACVVTVCTLTALASMTRDRSGIPVPVPPQQGSNHPGGSDSTRVTVTVAVPMMLPDTATDTHDGAIAGDMDGRGDVDLRRARALPVNASATLYHGQHRHPCPSFWLGPEFTLDSKRVPPAEGERDGGIGQGCVSAEPRAAEGMAMGMGMPATPNRNCSRRFDKVTAHFLPRLGEAEFGRMVADTAWVVDTFRKHGIDVLPIGGTATAPSFWVHFHPTHTRRAMCPPSTNTSTLVRPSWRRDSKAVPRKNSPQQKDGQGCPW